MADERHELDRPESDLAPGETEATEIPTWTSPSIVEVSACAEICAYVFVAR